MSYEEVKAARPAARPHSLSLENRGKLSLSGVEDVSGFDENTIILTTSLGELTIRGEQLHIERIDLDIGELSVNGHICAMSYEERVESHSLWSRLFG